MKKELFAFFSFSIVARAFPLLLLPFITKLGDDYDIAEFMLFLSASTFFSMFFLFGTQFEFTRVFFQKPEKLKLETINSLFVILLLFLVTISILALSNLDFIYIQSCIYGVCLAFIFYLQVFYRVSRKVFTFGMIDILRIGFPYVATVALLLFESFTIENLLLINITCVISILCAELNKNKSTNLSTLKKISAHKIFTTLKSGVFVFPHYISIYALCILDKILLKEYSNESVLAQYAVGFALGQVVVLITDSFNKVWGPFCLSGLSEGKIESLTVKAVKIGLTVILSIPIIYYSLSYFARIYFPNEFSLSIDVAAIVSVVYLIQLIYFLIFPYLVNFKLIKFIGAISLLSSLFGASVMLLLAINGEYSLLPLGILLTFIGQILGMLFVLRNYFMRQRTLTIYEE